MWNSQKVNDESLPSEQLTSLPFVAACNLIVDIDGRYLLVQEAKVSARSRYNLPAGKLEIGETLVDAAIREAKEESGLDVEVSYLIGIYQYPITSEGFSVVNFVFHSKVVGGSITRSAAHPVVSYFSPDEIQVLANSHELRGAHIPQAIADHLAGISFPSELIRIVPASSI